jgi:MFS family permease
MVAQHQRSRLDHVGLPCRLHDERPAAGDRVDANRVYLFGVGCTTIAHFAFGALADGFWSAMALRALAGVGWAGTYMTGLKLPADQVDAKMMSRAVTGHAASIGISGAASYILVVFPDATAAGS